MKLKQRNKKKYEIASQTISKYSSQRPKLTQTTILFLSPDNKANQRLMDEIDGNDIITAIKSSSSKKSSEPDGLPKEFYLHSWNIHKYEMGENNWSKIVNNIRHLLWLHSTRDLNLLQKITIYNRFILSKAWFVATIFPLAKK
jgi:hypothetical protein